MSSIADSNIRGTSPGVTMLTTMSELQHIASRYGIPNEDLFIMALNLCGVQSGFDFGRIRFALTLDMCEQFTLAERRRIKNFYLAVPIREDSDFSVRGD
ncbi:MAG: hypothetical protein V1800_16220, partial [Candidatus Latescibacterota bacterium]